MVSMGSNDRGEIILSDAFGYGERTVSNFKTEKNANVHLFKQKELL